MPKTDARFYEKTKNRSACENVRQLIEANYEGSGGRKMTYVGRREWQEADKERPPKKPSFIQRLSCSFREGYIFMGLQPSLGQ